MHELIGKHFNFAQSAFQIKDVRNVSGTFMVYAEPESQPEPTGAVARRAFHLDDIVHLVEPDSLR